MSGVPQGFRRERVDRGVAVRARDVFALSSNRDLAWLLLPRVVPLVLLLAFPLLGSRISGYGQTVMLNTLVVSLLALSWDLLASAGLVSLGQAFFFGLGGYVAGWLNARLGLPPALTIPIATVAGAAISTALLFPLLRLRGIYFGMITFALPLLLMRVVETTGVLGGTEGLSGLTPLPNRTLELYLVTIAALVTLLAFRRLATSDYGLLFQAIRDNDRAVIASGFDLQRRKAQVVFLAALPAAFAGAFVTHRYQFVGMPAFAMDYSTLPLTSAVIGGPGSFFGAMVGAFILVPLSELLREFGSLRVVVYSAMLLVFTIGLPEGLFRFAARKWTQLERLVPIEEAARER
ncbi:MAG TPA: branched-chain amino acid ABC transporter permease [Anaeromyxobacter sp.]|nr:branched-chain amino acid ABC transporter permease [Anaeromyxobacter sp.]